MKLEAIHLIEAQRCEIITKLSKLNVPSKWVLGREYEVDEGAIQKVVETMRIEEEPPIDDEIEPIKTFAESKSATNFKGFEALLFLTSTTNCFAPKFKRKLDKCLMNCDDPLRHFNKTLTN